MDVERIAHGDGGSHIAPALDPTWDKAKKLDWKASVTAADTGLRIEVTHDTGGRQMPWIRYTITVGSNCIGPLTFHDAWSYLNGVTTGAGQARRSVSA